MKALMLGVDVLPACFLTQQESDDSLIARVPPGTAVDLAAGHRPRPPCTSPDGTFRQHRTPQVRPREQSAAPSDRDWKEDCLTFRPPTPYGRRAFCGAPSCLRATGVAQEWEARTLAGAAEGAVSATPLFAVCPCATSSAFVFRRRVPALTDHTTPVPSPVLSPVPLSAASASSAQPFAPSPVPVRSPFRSVYLSGPISGLRYEEGKQWREYAAARLAPEILAYSPLRGHEHLAEEGILRGAYEKHPLTTARALTARDCFDCHACDLTLCNLLRRDRGLDRNVHRTGLDEHLLPSARPRHGAAWQRA